MPKNKKLSCLKRKWLFTTCNLKHNKNNWYMKTDIYYFLSILQLHFWASPLWQPVRGCMAPVPTIGWSREEQPQWLVTREVWPKKVPHLQLYSHQTTCVLPPSFPPSRNTSQTSSLPLLLPVPKAATNGNRPQRSGFNRAMVHPIFLARSVHHVSTGHANISL